MTRRQLCRWSPIGSYGAFWSNAESSKEWIEDGPPYRRDRKYRVIDWMNKHIPGFYRLYALYIYHSIYKQLKPRLDKPEWLDRFDCPPVDIHPDYIFEGEVSEDDM